MATEQHKCSFCGRERSEVNVLIAGINAHICDACITQAQNILNEEFAHIKEHKVTPLSLRTPREIKDYLDQYVIGQETDKRVMSVAV